MSLTADLFDTQRRDLFLAKPALDLGLFSVRNSPLLGRMLYEETAPVEFQRNVLARGVYVTRIHGRTGSWSVLYALMMIVLSSV